MDGLRSAISLVAQTLGNPSVSQDHYRAEPIVVMSSPLGALMRDQVEDFLQKRRHRCVPSQMPGLTPVIRDKIHEGKFQLVLFSL